MAQLPAIIPPVERPTEYDEAIAETLCERLMEGELLIDICEDERMPKRHIVYRWLHRIPEFSNMYTYAREVQSHYFAEENIVIARTPQIGKTVTKKGDGTVEVKLADMLGHRHLNIEARKWFASKLNRRVYGNQSENENGAPGVTINVRGGLPGD